MSKKVYCNYELIITKTFSLFEVIHELHFIKLNEVTLEDELSLRS